MKILIVLINLHNTAQLNSQSHPYRVTFIARNKAPRRVTVKKNKNNMNKRKATRKKVMKAMNSQRKTVLTTTYQNFRKRPKTKSIIDNFKYIYLLQ